MNARRFLGLFLSLFLLLGNWSPAEAQSSDSEFFAETGHNVKGDFLQFYRSVSDPALMFGYPITEQYVNKDGLTVQYFQRARFELSPAQPAGQRVALSNVGRETYVPAGQLNINDPLACDLYAQTGFPVCYAFRDFYNKYGGAAQFGYPISPFEFHDGVIVQYFEKARFEWQPWQAEGQRVGLTDSGRLYFDKLGENPDLLKPVPPGGDVTGPTVLSLQTRAFVWKAVTLANDQQLVFVVVQDQTLQPVSGAQGNARVQWPSGQVSDIPFTTNSNGVGIVPLSFADQPYGVLVTIEISVAKDGLNGKTTTSFRIWY
ncbi:MAG: hypothetical protein ACOYZ8_00655 [Chloroflexota bacterium]